MLLKLINAASYQCAETVEFTEEARFAVPDINF